MTTLNNTVLKFTATQLSNLAINPNPTPKATITSSSSFGFNIGCVFDSHVNLWVVDSLNDGIHEISHAQLVAGTADITPLVTIKDSTDLTSPSFATFDTAGNLWITSLSNSKIVEFTASQLLASSNTVIPNVVISSPSLDDPGQLEFDINGNLWVANFLNSTVVEFTPSQLAATGSPVATVVLSDDGSGSLSSPWGLQFDANNRLWVSNYLPDASGRSRVVKFGPAQLTASGHPTPRITLTGMPIYSAQLIFGPRY